MAAPIKPDAGGLPFPPASKEERGKLQEAAGKVSQATGGPASPKVRKASVSTAANTTPDLKKALASITQGFDLKTFLTIATPLRKNILTNFSDVELDAFEIALSKGTTLTDTHKPAFQTVKNQITQIRNERLLQEILKDHPDWNIEAWKNVLLEDKIWLLQIYELRNLGVDIPQIPAPIPPIDTLNLLKPDTKKAINEALSDVKTLVCIGKKLQKCPKAIHLLVNLEKLVLSRNQLTAPPEVSRNVNLLELNLGDNELTAPPNVSRNVKLQELHLYTNKLTAAPDVSQNVNLKILNLAGNQLTAPPDVRRNVNLQGLYLYTNKLTVAPDVSQNVHLEDLYLSNNQFTAQAKEMLTKLKRERNKVDISF